MIKNIFYKIMSNDMQRQKMNSLKEQNKIYDLFCENGYTESFDNFKIEMKDFLNSDESSKIINNDSGELSDELLEMVAGGVNVKRALTVGFATLITAFNISTAVANPIMSGVTAIGDDTSISASTSASESDSFSNLGEEINNDINNYDMKNSNIDKNQKSSGENGGVQKAAIKSEQSDSVGFEKSKTQSSKEEMASLKQENENLKKQNAEMARLKQENENLKKQNAEMARLKQENENLKKQNAETEKLKQENENLKIQNKNLLNGNKSIEQNKNNQILNQISELNNATSSRDKIVSGLEKNSDNLNKTVETLFNSINKIENSNKEKDNLLNQIKDLQNLINQNNVQQRNLKKENLKLDDMLKQLQSVKNNVNTESDSINKLESQLKEKDSKIKELEGQIEYLNNKLNAAGSNVQRESLDTNQITNKDSIIKFLETLDEDDKLRLAPVKEDMDNVFKKKLSDLNEKYNEDLKKIENEYNNDFANKIKGGTKEELARKEKEEKERKEKAEKEAEEKERKEKEEKERKEQQRKKQYNRIKRLKEKFKVAVKERDLNESIDSIKELISSFGLDNSLKEELTSKLVAEVRNLYNSVDTINKSKEETISNLRKTLSKDITRLSKEFENDTDRLVSEAGVDDKDKARYLSPLLLYLSAFNETEMRKGIDEEKAVKNIIKTNTGIGQNSDDLSKNIINEIGNFCNRDFMLLQNERYKLNYEIENKIVEISDRITEYQESNIEDADTKIQTAKEEFNSFATSKRKRIKELDDIIHQKGTQCFKNIVQLVTGCEAIPVTNISAVKRDVANVINDIMEKGLVSKHIIEKAVKELKISVEKKTDLANNIFQLRRDKENEFKTKINNLDSNKQEYESKIRKKEDEHIENMKQIMLKYSLSDSDKKKFNNFITHSSDKEEEKDLKDGKGNNLLGNDNLKKPSNQDKIPKNEKQKEEKRSNALKKISEQLDAGSEIRRKQAFRSERLAQTANLVKDEINRKLDRSTSDKYSKPLRDYKSQINSILNEITFDQSYGTEFDKFEQKINTELSNIQQAVGQIVI